MPTNTKNRWQSSTVVRVSVSCGLAVLMGAGCLIVYRASLKPSAHTAHPTTVAWRAQDRDNAWFNTALEQYQTRVAHVQAKQAELNTALVEIKTELRAHPTQQALSEQATTLHALQRSVQELTRHTHVNVPSLGTRLQAQGWQRTLAPPDDSHVIPAGATVPAVVLMGAQLTEATANNPKPMLIRLTEDAVLPNGVTRSLKHCVVTAALTAHWAARRANVRLERLSCVAPNGRVIDVPAYGTVMQAQQEGLPGQLVQHRVRRYGHALWRGLLRDVGHVLAPTRGDGESIGLPGATGTITPWQRLAQQHGANGLQEMSQVVSRLAGPVLRVDAGLPVTVVFLKRTTLGPSTGASTGVTA